MDDPRYIILPGELRNDARLKLSHLRVAMVLGAYSKRKGWTDLSQDDIGEIAGMARETVSRCVADLVEWGWVARRKKDGQNRYIYRFIMDRDEDCDAQLTVPDKRDPAVTVQCDPQITTNVTHAITINKEDSSTYKDQLTSRAGACEADATPARSAGGARPALLIRNGDASWDDWLAVLPPAIAAQARERGALIAPTRWPKTDLDINIPEKSHG